MFERFTPEARQVVVSSQDEARQLHHNFIGTEHLLLGLLDQAGSPTRAVFERHGVTRTAALEVLRRFAGHEQLDAAALGTVGIDLDAVRDSVEATFGAGALDVSLVPARRALLRAVLVGGRRACILNGHETESPYAGITR